LGTQRFAVDPVSHTEQRIIAFTLMRRFFAWFGATGQYLPALAVIGILLSWHIAKRDPWIFRPGVLAGMTLESMLVGVPLLAGAILWAHYLPLAAGTAPDLREMIVLSIGAGVYEELVFRLIIFTVLYVFFADLLRMRKRWAGLLVVVLSSILFSLYHYLGTEPPTWQSFAFRGLAGVFFAVVFLLRGFGITAGSHVAYDIFVSLLHAAG
jgi:membrane protease YdiL (CAAX protease family)